MMQTKPVRNGSTNDKHVSCNGLKHHKDGRNDKKQTTKPTQSPEASSTVDALPHGICMAKVQVRENTEIIPGKASKTFAAKAIDPSSRRLTDLTDFDGNLTCRYGGDWCEPAGALPKIYQNKVPLKHLEI